MQTLSFRQATVSPSGKQSLSTSHSQLEDVLVSKITISIVLVDETGFPADKLDKIQNSFSACARIIRVVDELGCGVTDHAILARMDSVTALTTMDAKLHNTALREGFTSFCWFQNTLWTHSIPKVGTFQLRIVSPALKTSGEPVSAEVALLIGAYNATVGDVAKKRNRTTRSRIAHRAISISNVTFVRCYLHTQSSRNSLLFGVSILAQTKERNVGTTELYARLHGLPDRDPMPIALLIVLLKLLALHLHRARVVFYGDNLSIAAALKYATNNGSGENDVIGNILTRAARLFSAIEFGTNQDRSGQVASKVRALSEHDAGGEMVDTDYQAWAKVLASALESIEQGAQG